MELIEGYKQANEVGIIPEDWYVNTLENCCISKGLVRGPFGSALKKENFVREGFKVYEQKNAIYGDISPGSYYVNQKKFNGLRRFEVLPGDFIVSCSGTIGKIYLIPNNSPRGIINQALLKITIDDRVVLREYFLHYFQWKKFQDKIIDSTQGGAMKNLVGMSIFKKTKIAIPSTKEEQASIANALSDADCVIQSLASLIVKKQNIKQGVMQSLLNPYENGQLKKDWVYKKLGDIGLFLKGSGVKKDESSSGILPCVRYGEIYTKHSNYIKQFYSFISQEVSATATLLKTGDLLFTGSGETKEEIGKCVAFIDKVEAYAGGDIVILRPTEINSLFLGYYLNTVAITHQKASKGQGDTVVHISADALSSIELLVPNEIHEQARIANIFNDIDKEIMALKLKLTKAKQIKQGMMQNLLTGKIRLV